MGSAVAIAAFLLVAMPGQSRAAPLYADGYSQTSGSMAWVATGPSFTRWNGIYTNYTYECSQLLPNIAFTGNGPINGPWVGSAWYWQKQDGDCVGGGFNPLVAYATSIDSIRFCDVVLGCFTASRINPIDIPESVFTGSESPVAPPDQCSDPGYATNPQCSYIPPPAPTETQPTAQSPYLLVFDENGYPRYVPRTPNSDSPWVTGDEGRVLRSLASASQAGAARRIGAAIAFGATSLVAADAITGGKAGKRLLKTCRGPLKRVIRSESKAFEAGLKRSKSGVASQLRAQAKAGPALGKCLAKAGFRGKISKRDAKKVETRLGTEALPGFLTKTLKKSGASAAGLDALRLNLRSFPATALKGKLAKDLASKSRARALRKLAASF